MSGMFPTDDEVDDLLSHMDEDRSGMVDREELTKHMALQVQITQVVTNCSFLSVCPLCRFKLERKWIPSMILKRHFCCLTKTESEYCISLKIPTVPQCHFRTNFLSVVKSAATN